MHQRLSLCLLLCVFLLSLQCLGDQPRYRTRFRSKNGMYELRMTKQIIAKLNRSEGKKLEMAMVSEWGLFDMLRGTRLYSLKGSFTSKTVEVSSDGRRMVVIDDFSEGYPHAGRRMLEFYRDGRLMKAYHLGTLLSSTDNVSESVSHFSWFSTWQLDYGLNTDFREDLSTLTITTYELRTMIFDTRSGKLLSNKLDPAVKFGSVLVYGEVNLKGKNTYIIEVCHCVFGKVPVNGIIKFSSLLNLTYYGPTYMTILLNDGKYIETSHRNETWILNRCTYKYSHNTGKEQ